MEGPLGHFVLLMSAGWMDGWMDVCRHGCLEGGSLWDECLEEVRIMTAAPAIELDKPKTLRVLVNGNAGSSLEAANS